MSGQLVSVRSRFERFPATVKGAFVVRGEDPNPHQVALRVARTVHLANGQQRQIKMSPALVDAPPRKDVFLPFEFSVTEMEPGWYRLECDLDVDGVSGTYSGDRRLFLGWPRGTVRRGSIALGRKVTLDDATVLLDQLELATDRVELRYMAERPVTVTFLAGAEPLVALDGEFDQAAGKGKATAFPVMKAQPELRLELKAGRDAVSMEVVLP